MNELAHLLQLTGQGDKMAFKQLYDATAARLLGQAMALLRARDAAEDAVQDAYLRIWAGAVHYDPARGHALAWMARIMRNVAIDHLRRMRKAERYLAPDEDAPEIAVDPEPVGDRLDLNAALASLPPAQRDTVCKVVVEGWTHEEVALHEGVPLPTAKSRVQRGLRRLRAVLEGEAGPAARRAMAPA
jgi:RNA polymerase sigma-70 factor (ECF subfamily)